MRVALVQRMAGLLVGRFSCGVLGYAKLPYSEWSCAQLLPSLLLKGAYNNACGSVRNLGHYDVESPDNAMYHIQSTVLYLQQLCSLTTVLAIGSSYYVTTSQQQTIRITQVASIWRLLAIFM